ncbi:MAG TPA: glycosyltransferase family 4 protein [Clostridiaceae bacterium]|nr:glycosyltransferase family 4 protein [Clostridiaceae bacterium]
MSEEKTKSHIVFLTGEYLPNPSQLGACIANIVPFLQAADMLVTVVSTGRCDKKKPYSIGDQQIIPAFSFWQRMHCHFLEKDREKGGSRWYRHLAKGVHLIDRTIDFMKSFTPGVNVNQGRKNAFRHALEQVKQPTVLVPTCFPIEAVAAAADYARRHDIQLIPYFLDPFADNVSVHRTQYNQRRKYKIHLAFEKKMLDQADHVLLLEHLSSHFEETFPELKDKFVKVEHPMLVDLRQRLANAHGSNQALPAFAKYLFLAGTNSDINLKTKRESDVPQFYCAGSFIQKVRTPDYVISVMIELAKMLPLHLNFYTAGDCEKQITAAAAATPHTIFAHGFVTKKEADCILLMSDVLIHVCNKNRNQSPSKIYEYLGSGLPIINFYYNDDDPLIETIAAYPLGKNIKIPQVIEWDQMLSRDVRDIYNWFLQVQDRRIPFAEVKKLYPKALPNRTADQLLKLIR